MLEFKLGCYIFSRGSLEVFVGLYQRLISQELKSTFARDDVGSDSGTVEDVYRGSYYGTRNGWRRGVDPKNFWRQLRLPWPFTGHDGCYLLHVFPKVCSFYRIRGRDGNRRLPCAEIVWGVSKIFEKIILELERELQRLNFFFLWSLWFRKGF